MAGRSFNFSAGPAALPDAVMERAHGEFLDFEGLGASVMEISHRSKQFIGVAERAESNLRKLLLIPDNYKVLFLQGGATLQFAAVPMNLSGPNQSADYIDTGAWSTKAIKEADKFCNVNVAASARADGYGHVPAADSWKLSKQPSYLHLCSNETIGGVQFHQFPDMEALGLKDTPLVADMSSDFLARPLDISKFGLIYAGAQKNVAPAGLTLVIVREDLLGRGDHVLPAMLDYQVHAAADSMSNTPATFPWYMAGLVFEWLLDQGGLTAIEAINKKKSDTLYGVIDNSNFYSCPVVPENRSTMNVPFTLADSELDSAFLSGADSRGMLNLKGHRSVGGMRASIYNAVSQDAVDALASYMAEFERDNG